jgi:hypothetical protein
MGEEREEEDAMQIRSLLSVFLGVAIVAVGSIFVTGKPTLRAAGTQGRINGPQELVEFSSVLTRTDPRGTVQTGRFFRGPDGSTRHEVGPDLTIVTMVEIKNISQATYYLWDARNPAAWHAHPMKLGSDGAPFPRSIKSSMLSPNANGQVIEYDGFEALQIAANGVTKRVVPSLNFLEVDRLTPDGTRVMHTSIKVGPVSDVAAGLAAPHSGPSRNPLFEPPATASVEWHADARGIVVTEGSIIERKGHGSW